GAGGGATIHPKTVTPITIRATTAVVLTVSFRISMNPCNVSVL
ncbi:hypothetical protein VCNHCC008D_002242B, partial [Vibrio cholerae O1 str. NHCC-008D]